MVGFPGETEEEFEELLDFVRSQRFERMGAFAYSEEEGTYAARHYKDDVPADVKQQRLDRLMEAQEEISFAAQESKIGHTLRVMIDRLEGDYYVGRTQYDSPEVDPEVLIPAEGVELQPGTFHNVTITDAEAYELFGALAD
jgi:ribosomal protein S12 methylthiotransferase